MRGALVIVSFALVLQACATNGGLHAAREQHDRGDSEAAFATLDPDTLQRRDRLLGWLDRGLFAHVSGQYPESRDAFFRAGEIIDELERVRISEQSGALVVSDRLISYRGEHSERLWIHAFQMMNFLHLDRPDSAAVEARRAIELLGEHSDALTGAHFTRGLAAHAFERIGQYASASIEYARLADAGGLHGVAAAQAARVAARAGRPDDQRRFEVLAGGASYPDTDTELVLFVFDGRIAPKRSGDLFIGPTTRIAFPYYAPNHDRSVTVTAMADATPLAVASISTDTTDVSRDALAARGRSIAARQTARAFGKHALGDAAAERSEALGALVRVLLVLIEQADTRSWETLPATLALARVPIPPGSASLDVHVNGRPLEPVVPLSAIRAGRVTYRHAMELAPADRARRWIDSAD